MRTIDIQYPDQQAGCIFPASRTDLPQAVTELDLNNEYPVIVLIGGYIESQYTAATQKAIETVSVTELANGGSISRKDVTLRLSGHFPGQNRTAGG